MAPLPSFIRCPRMTKRSARPAGRPTAGDEVVLDAPDQRLSPALVAAARGEYDTVAALLTATRAASAWENRDRYVRHLAGFARSRPEWFEAWRSTAPDDPGVLLVGAQLAVDRAWPSPARAELLREVSPFITAAARADDRDPVPWRIALDHARGSQAGHRYVEELWEAAVRRAPHHHGCHVAALRYLAASWHGAHRECLDFADRAAQDAPADSLVQALPARAAFGYLTDGCGPEVPRARLDAAADRALALSARFPAADPWPAGIRNKLLYVLIRLERWEDARAELALIGPYATSFPWDRFSDDPLGHFLRLREHLLAPGPGPLAAGPAAWSPAPPGEHGGHVRAGDH
ncbi:membrane protein [Streptomyces sp. MMG1121]|nr:membrane protein [Streptomyces sp. MMG1121]